MSRGEERSMREGSMYNEMDAKDRLPIAEELKSKMDIVMETAEIVNNNISRLINDLSGTPENEKPTKDVPDNVEIKEPFMVIMKKTPEQLSKLHSTLHLINERIQQLRSMLL